jgi:hypothetical protein
VALQIIESKKAYNLSKLSVGLALWWTYNQADHFI